MAEPSVEAEPIPFRHPPDTRPSGCPKQYDEAKFANLTVSVVLPWLAETWEHLSGTLGALLEYTPDELIKEYIFVSDGNKDSKEKELRAMSSKVRVIELPERQGLIR